MKRIGENLQEELKKIFYLIRPAVILAAIYLMAFYSIFRSNFNYLDDLGRKHSGYHGWLDWSRWFTQIFSSFLHADTYLSDISPLPQWIACILMALGCVILLKVFGEERRIGIVNILAASLIGLTPYFLGIISYKYDSPYMAFSFLVSVFPFLFYKKKEIVYMLISCVCLVLMCTSYQASSGIFPLITLFLAVRNLNMGIKMRKVVRFIGVSVICYAISLGGYWLFLMKPNEASVFSVRQFFQGAFFQKYISFVSLINSDFKASWKILLFLLIIAFIIVFISGSKLKKIVSFFLSLAGVLLGSIFCLGINLLLDVEKYDARAMYGLGVFFGIMGICISFAETKRYYNLVCVLLFWCFFTFAFSYGNALAVQQGYIDYRVQLVAGDLNTLECMRTDKIKIVQVEGDIGLSPVILNMSEGFGMMNRLVPSEFSRGYWGEYYFLNYFHIPQIVRSDEEIDIDSLDILKDTMYHRIYGDGKHVVVELK